MLDNNINDSDNWNMKNGWRVGRWWAGGARLNVGMLDDNKKWVQKFSRSQYDYRATALDGSPWHLPFSHRVRGIQSASTNVRINIISLRFLREICARSFLAERLHWEDLLINKIFRVPLSESTMSSATHQLSVAILLVSVEYQNFSRTSIKIPSLLFDALCIAHAAVPREGAN